MTRASEETISAPTISFGIDVGWTAWFLRIVLSLGLWGIGYLLLRGNGETFAGLLLFLVLFAGGVVYGAIEGARGSSALLLLAWLAGGAVVVVAETVSWATSLLAVDTVTPFPILLVSGMTVALPIVVFLFLLPLAATWGVARGCRVLLRTLRR